MNSHSDVPPSSPKPGATFAHRIIPQSVRENLSRRVLPFGLARALSMGIPVLVQFCLLWRFGAEEAGVFWVLASAATLLAFVSDAGAQNAFPILFGPSPGCEHPQLRRVLRFRLGIAILAGIGLAIIGRVGKVAAGDPLDRLVLFALIVGRVILMSHQGFHYSRERFTRLFFAALAENLVAMLGFGFLLVASEVGVGLPCRPAMFALLFFALATWIAIVLLDVPREAWGFGKPLQANNGETTASSSSSDLHPLAFLWPFAVSGIGGAVFTKGDAVIAGFILEPATAGILGMIKAFYRLLTFPVYMSGQGLFPPMRAAWVGGNLPEMERLKHLHRMSGCRLLAFEFALVILVGLFAGVYAAFAARNLWGDLNQEWITTGLWYLIALPVCIPNSFIMPDYFSREQEWLVAKITVLLAIGRPLLAVLLATRAGMAGMALNHLLFDMMQGAVYTVVIPWREGRLRKG